MDAKARRGTIDFGILTVREDEFEAVLQRLPQDAGVVSGRRRYNVRRVETAQGDTYAVAVIRCIEQGNGEAQAAANDMLEELNPHWILVVGIGGGAPSEELLLGDVVVSTRIIDFTGEAALPDHSRESALAGGPIHPDAQSIVVNLPAMKPALGGWNDAASIGMSQPPVEISPDAL